MWRNLHKELSLIHIFNSTKNNLKNYWCGTSSLPNTDLPTEYTSFTAVQTRFVVLNTTKNAALIEQIRTNKDQLEITPTLFTSLNITKSSVRTRKAEEAEGTVSAVSYTQLDVYKRQLPCTTEWRQRILATPQYRFQTSRQRNWCTYRICRLLFPRSPAS